MLARSDQGAQGRAGHRSGERVAQHGQWIGRRRPVLGSHDGGPIAGDIDRQPIVSVGEVDLHRSGRAFRRVVGLGFWAATYA